MELLPFDQILLQLDSISLEEMEKVRLMNRIDTKYVTSVENISRLLGMAHEFYLIQEIAGGRNMPYYTKYFDTAAAKMYYDHERGKKSRRKIRIRRYEGSIPLAFMEIKDKNNKGRTKKKRVVIENQEFLEPYAEFISSHSEFSLMELTERIENRFNRITLVNKEMTERITIDTGIRFRNLINAEKAFLPSLAVVEWKRDRLAGASMMQKILHHLHLNPGGFSKYVIGMALTDPTLRRNRIKPKLLQINKIH